jgi:hypothetical protein
MQRILRKHAFKHAVQAFDVWRVHVTRAAARLENEERVGVERTGVQIVGIRLVHLAHRFGVGLVLFHARLHVEVLDVTNGKRVDECAFLGRGFVLQ